MGTKMKILMIAVDYPPVPGGISAHVYELAKAFSKAGHQVAVVTRRRGNDPEYSRKDGWEVYWVTLKYVAFVYGLQLRKFVKNLLPEVQPDLIHIHGMGPLEWYDIKGIPLVYTNHTSGYLKRINKGGLRRMWMLKRHFAKVDLFLAPSRELLHVPFPIRAHKEFITNGVDSTSFVRNEETRRALRSALGYGEEDKVAIVTRRLVDKNGVIHLARACQFVKDGRLRFLVIGDGPERAAVEEEFRRHLGDRVSFLGNKRHEEIVAYYSAADFSILPSLMEATSISGLEAMAAGLPLVGTEVGGIPELIHPGGNGFLCRPADPLDLAEKIGLLLSDDLAAMGAYSRRLVEERFDWSQIAQLTLRAYDHVIPV
jgi:glycosyltransferase involved in cell wall biosynthesis